MVYQCLCEYVSSIWVRLIGSYNGYGKANHYETQESVQEQLSTRQVQLEINAKKCITEARRYHSNGSKALFRGKMIEHRRIQGQMIQLQRFRDNAMTQFDALQNYELNQTFVKAMKGIVGLDKNRIKHTREDAEKIVGDLHETLADVDDLSDFLGHPVSSVEEIDDDELEKEFMDEIDSSEKDSIIVPNSDIVIKEPLGYNIRPTPTQHVPYVDNRIEQLLDVRPMLQSF